MVPGSQDTAKCFVTFEKIDTDGTVKVKRAEITLHVKRIWWWSRAAQVDIIEAFTNRITHEILDALMVEAYSYYDLLYNWERVKEKSHDVLFKLGLEDRHKYWMILEKRGEDDIRSDECRLPSRT